MERVARPAAHNITKEGSGRYLPSGPVSAQFAKLLVSDWKRAGPWTSVLVKPGVWIYSRTAVLTCLYSSSCKCVYLYRGSFNELYSLEVLTVLSEVLPIGTTWVIDAWD